MTCHGLTSRIVIDSLEVGRYSPPYLQLLADRGIEYLFANASTDFAPLIGSFAMAQALVNRD